MTVEHFGATEWLDDARGYRPTGYNEMGAIWHSQTPIIAPTIEAMRADNFVRTSALRPAGDYMIAVGGPLHKAGVPSLSYTAGPNDLVALGDHLDQLPAAALKAGDTAVWAQDGGCEPITPCV